MVRSVQLGICILLALTGGLLNHRTPAFAQQQTPAPEGFDLRVREWAQACKQEVIAQFETLLSSDQLTRADLFDTFYIPVPGTDPPKYHTRYDSHLDQALRPILDSFLNKDDRLIFVVAVDRNGYLPVHNTRYSDSLTGERETDLKKSRDRRMFNDRTGLAAARNTKPWLLQRYSRDTGEEIFDLSVPLFVRDRHWGAVRIGYTYNR